MQQINSEIPDLLKEKNSNQEPLIDKSDDIKEEEEVLRPAHEIIEALNEIDDDLLQKVSSRS